MRFYKLANQEGVILLEVLLAVAILAFGLTAVIQAMMSGLRACTLASDYLRATSALDQKMIEKYIQKSTDKPSSEDGSLSAPFEHMTYAVDIVPAREPGFDDMSFYQIKSTVYWQAGKGQRALSAGLLIPGEVKP
jgi:Tfp pilus assembly protein PilV